jgi:hypothetical protein
LVAYWANQYLSTSADIPTDPSALLPLLDTIIPESFGKITESELAIRFWAYQDGHVRKYVEQVDAVRRDFVLKDFQPMISDETQAQLMADMLFAMTIGSITAMPRIPTERVLEMYQEFKSFSELGD